jgi:LuxR family maltose regulon positive regulatory protein
MAIPLINTKLYAPLLRPSHIARARLRASLNSDFLKGDTFTRKLTIISAPAGYGKTTLTVEWLNNLDLQIAWFSLDENDNDPVRFLTYLLNAFKHIQPQFGSVTLDMLQSPQLLPLEVLLTPLLNEIEAIHSPLILVLDDYHLIQTPTIHQYLNFLVEHQPPQLHTVIVSREDPQLPLHRLRARGQMLEIRQEDIRFTLQETTDFLQKAVNQELSPENIAAIEHRTEGWVTGMQLLALSLQKQSDAQGFIRSFAGSNRFILDYLFEEVFHQQLEEIQTFLIKTSVLENLSAGLCEAVTGYNNSSSILKSLDQSNLFILPLDQSQTWYRYHRLFLDLLRHQLRLHQEISQSALHNKASLWYEDQGYREEAVKHALAGSDWERATDLIYQASEAMLKSGAIATMLGWLQKIPVGFIQAKPEYCLTYAWPLLLTGQVNAANPFLETAEKLASHDSALLGEIAAAQAFQAQTMGDEARMVERSEHALSLLPETDLSSRSILAMNLGIAYWHAGAIAKAERYLNQALPAARQTGNKYAEVTSLLFLGRVHAVRGRLQTAAKFFNGIVEAQVRAPIVALAYLDLSMLHYEWNDLKAADRYLEQGIEIIGPNGNLEFQVAGLMQKARLRLAQGDRHGALEVFEKYSQIKDVHEIPVRSRTRMAACAVEIGIALGDLEMAERWAEHATSGPDTHPFYRFLCLAPIRLLMAQNKLPEAEKLLAKAYEIASEAGWQYGMTALRVMQTLAAPSNSAALEYLTDALTLAQPEKFIRTFMDGGTTLVPLLKEAARRGIFPVYVGEILAVFEDMAGTSTVGLPPGIEPLSERELEVLRLLAAGLTNRQIAEQLIVSISTVKSHVHHISSKLGASNRTQAVTQARELGLL